MADEKANQRAFLKLLAQRAELLGPNVTDVFERLLADKQADGTLGEVEESFRIVMESLLKDTDVNIYSSPVYRKGYVECEIGETSIIRFTLAPHPDSAPNAIVLAMFKSRFSQKATGPGGSKTTTTAYFCLPGTEDRLGFDFFDKHCVQLTKFPLNDRGKSRVDKLTQLENPVEIIKKLLHVLWPTEKIKQEERTQTALIILQAVVDGVTRFAAFLFSSPRTRY